MLKRVQRKEKPNAIKQETMVWSDEHLVRILRNGAFLICSDMLYAIAVVCEAADRIEDKSLLSHEAVEAGAEWLRDLDIGPMDEERRPIELPTWPPCPTWQELPEQTRENYRHRARGVLQAARSISEGGRQQMKIALCGSARFEREFKEANKALSLAGHVVHTLSVYPSDEGGKEWYSQDEKAMLDRVHLLKIECSDAVLIISPGGYIGDSTRREIDHAERLGKQVFYSISEVCATEGGEGDG